MGASQEKYKKERMDPRMFVLLVSAVSVALASETLDCLKESCSKCSYAHVILHCQQFCAQCNGQQVESNMIVSSETRKILQSQAQKLTPKSDSNVKPLVILQPVVLSEPVETQSSEAHNTEKKDTRSNDHTTGDLSNDGKLPEHVWQWPVKGYADLH